MKKISFFHTVLLAALLCEAVFLQRSVAQDLLSDTPLESTLSDEDIFDLSIEELQDLDIHTGKPGWFGNQLNNLGINPYLHGYAAFMYRDYDLNRSRPVDTFDLHYFNIIIGANIEDTIAAEVLLEFEHGGEETGIRYGIIDYKVAEPLILRMGKFLVPMGKFNEHYIPEYANKLPDRPHCLWNIVPSVWSEVGVQLRGSYELATEQSINYAFYIVNGLEQAANSDGSVGEGGSIRSMRRNHRDSNHRGKAYGGRFGFKPTHDWELGASYYTGAYTIDGNQNLSIMDLDAEYQRDKWTLRGELVGAIQETSSGNLNKWGFYAEAAYRIRPKYEPVIRYDQADLDDGSGHVVQRGTVGLVFYPRPDLHPLFSFRLSQSYLPNNGQGDQAHEFVAQCVIGF